MSESELITTEKAGNNPSFASFEVTVMKLNNGQKNIKVCTVPNNSYGL